MTIYTQKNILFLCLLGGLLCGVVWFLTPKERPVQVEQYHSDRFRSVSYIANPNIKDVFVYLIFPKGEADNPFAQGMAHYVEHLAWISAFQESGASHSNAWTNLYTTGYWQRTTVHGFDDALRTLSRVTGPITVDDEFALQERDILLREYEYRMTEQPQLDVMRDMDRFINDGTPYVRSVIGDPSEIAHYSLSDAKTLHQDSHRLDNAALIVYGNIARDRVMAATGATTPFSDVADAPRRPLVPATDHAVVGLDHPIPDTFRYAKRVPLPACGAPARCAVLAALARDILDSPRAGGIAGPLRFDAFIARHFEFDLWMTRDHWIDITFTAQPDTGIDLPQLRDRFIAVLDQTLNNGVPQDSFDRIKARQMNGYASVLPKDVAYNIFDTALHRHMVNLPVVQWSDYATALSGITHTDVNRFLRDLATEGRVITRFVTPKG